MKYDNNEYNGRVNHRLFHTCVSACRRGIFGYLFNYEWESGVNKYTF